MLTNNLLYSILVWAPGVLFAITLHEWAHGFAASRYGDQTPARMGRLTLNPLPHIDPVMTLLVPGLMLATSLIAMGTPFVFGSAKPVPVNANNFRDRNGRRRTGTGLRVAMFWVAFAGPLVNFLLALGCAGLLHLLVVTAHTPPVLPVDMLLAAIKMNVLLGVFNLFPLPPLDGGRMATALLPPPLDQALASLERIGMAVVLLLAFSGLLGAVLSPVLAAVTRLLIQIAIPR
ncbi:MAG: site-2 protease family protein [Magnetococcus sp. XQGC-1]